ncbi:unnamed protein product, partial [Rotaria magnacalcarata]
ALPLPLILSPYTEKLLTKNKKIIYQNVDGSEISNDDPDVEYIRDY